MQTVESIIHINLLPVDEQVAARRMPLGRSVATALLALGTVITMMAVTTTVQGIRVRALQGEITGLEAEAAELRPVTLRVQELERQRSAVLTRLTVIEQLDRDRFARVRLADELSRRLPDQVWLTSFAEQAGAVVITGVTFSNLSVAELISRLENSLLYTSVDLVVSRRGKVDDHEIINFTLSAHRQSAAGAPTGQEGPQG